MSDTADNGGVERAQRGPRSPGYPAMTLRQAIDRARKLKEYQPGRKPIPIDTALKVWGYAPKSGAGLQTVASVKKFGLVEDSGSLDQRTVKITDLARKILIDDRPETQVPLLQRAALMPKIHQEIRDRYPHGLPDDSTLRIWLHNEKDFNEKAIPGFLKDLRATFEYAQLDAEPDEGKNDGGDDAHVKVGDWVQWTSQGVAQFPSPRKVVRVDEYEGEKYVFVVDDEGQEGAVPMSQTTVEKPAAGTGASAPPPVLSPRADGGLLPGGMEESRWKIPSGYAVLRYPAGMNEKDFAVLEQQVALLAMSFGIEKK